MSIKNPKLKKELQKALGLNKAPTLEVGFFQTAKYPDGQFVASIASQNEYGRHNIPPRAFFRSAVANYGDSWGETAFKFFKNAKANKALGMLGEVVRGDIVKSIDRTLTPPNSPLTIAKKGSSHPLIDTGLLRASVNFELKE